jgi:hypothetical protein
MAELKTYDVKESGQGQTITSLKKFVLLNVASMSDEDWVVVSQLTTVNVVKCIDLSDGSVYTATISDNNKITIDAAEGASDDNILILAVGV